MTIKAIETRYKGYRFRSRLEARWAVFLDAMRVKWSYEPEGFVLSDGTQYLPDFFIHSEKKNHRLGSGWWIEIKGTTPTQVEVKKFVDLCVQTEHNGYLFSGLPAERPWLFVHRSGNTVIHGEEKFYDVGPIDIFRKNCLITELCFMQSQNWHLRKRDPFAAARSARFEFGQSGV